MKSIIDCFSGITPDNAVCSKHSTCNRNHYYNLPKNDTCAHKELEFHSEIQNIQKYVLENDFSQEHLNALLSAIFILSGCCTCQFSWDTLNFFAELLAQASSEKFELLCENWVIQQYLVEMPGLWGREDIVRSTLSKLKHEGNITRGQEMIELIKPLYNCDNGVIPYVLRDFLPEKIHVETI